MVVISQIHRGVSLMWHYKGAHNTNPVMIKGPYQSEYNVSVLVEGLLSNVTYTFCLIGYKKFVTSPLSCRSYYTGEEEQDIWLTKDAKAAALSLFILGLLLMFSIGSSVMYFTIRRFPRIVNRSKIVTSNDNIANDLIPPRESCNR